MSLTRNLCKSIGLNDDQTDAIINAHVEVVDALKGQIGQFKDDAEKLRGVQKELDELKSGKDWKAEYDKEHEAFNAYKAEIVSKETLTRKQALFKTLLTESKIPEKFHDRIVKLTDFSEMELDGDGFKNPDALKSSIKTDWGEYAAVDEVRGADVDTPPHKDTNSFNDMSLADKMKYANENPNSPEVRDWLRKE